jgi:prepilin-type N-terminal cleavage/methylation domain-containing protein
MNSQFAFRRASGQKGFSLIECVISMAVLTIGALGLLGVFGVAVKATAASQGDLIARQLASETIEGITRRGIRRRSRGHRSRMCRMAGYSSTDSLQ